MFLNTELISIKENIYKMLKLKYKKIIKLKIRFFQILKSFKIFV